MLSAIEKIRLGRQLNTLVQDSVAAKGLKKISLGREINAILLQLGYGAGEASAMPVAPEQAGEVAASEAGPVDGKPADAGGVAASDADPVDEKPAEAGEVAASEADPVDDRPAIVVSFLAGECTQQPPEAFIKTLTTLEPYLNQFLTMEEVVRGSEQWVRENYPQAA